MVVYKNTDMAVDEALFEQFLDGALQKKTWQLEKMYVKHMPTKRAKDMKVLFGRLGWQC